MRRIRKACANALRAVAFGSIGFAAALSAEAQTAGCGDYHAVSGFGAEKNGMVLCLVEGANSAPWKKPRQILFASESELLVTDFASWGNHKAGKLWSYNLETREFSQRYRRGNRTHGLAIDRFGRVLVGDAGAVIRLTEQGSETLVTGLPTKGSHPLTHMILLPNQDLIVNVGAPSDQCKKEMKRSANKLTCHSRDSEAELRRYRYRADSDSYDPAYQVAARGLRNSMALLYNSLTGDLYQAENNMDTRGIVEEFNRVPLTSETSGAQKAPDYGWPFCSGFGERNQSFGRSFRTFCQKVNADPLFNIPAHAAPLDMEYYCGGLFATLDGAILMGWHGHSRTVDYALVAYPTDAAFEPLVSDPERNGFMALLKGKNNRGDKLRPVGVTTDRLGRIWFVDDRSKRLYMLTKASGSSDQTQQDGNHNALQLSQQDKEDFAEIYRRFSAVETCSACHQEIVPRRAFDTLDNMLASGWLRPGASAVDMPFVGSLSGESEHFRPMPPAPDQAFAKAHAEVYHAIRVWAAGVLNL